MKKITVFLILAAAMLLSACAESTDTGGTVTAAGSVENSDSGNSGKNNIENTDASDGTAIENTVYGEVHEVIGNLLVLDLIEMPDGMMTAFSDGMMRGFGSDGARSFNMDEMSEEQKAAMQERMKESGMSDEEIQAFQDGIEGGNVQGFFSGGAQPAMGGTWGDGEMPMFDGEGPMTIMGQGGENITRGAGASPRIKQELQYTGEQTEVIIPVGTPVVTYGFTAEGMTETEADLSSVKSGSVIMISYNDDGSIEKVLLVSA